MAMTAEGLRRAAAYAAAAIGAAVMYADPAAAQAPQVALVDFAVQGEGCPLKDAMRVTLTNTPAAAVTRSAIRIEFTGMNPGQPGNSFSVVGPDAMSQCAVAVQLSASAANAPEVKFTLRGVTLDVRSTPQASGEQLSVSSQVIVGRAQSRTVNTVVAPVVPAAGTDPAIPATSSIPVNGLQAAGDIRGSGTVRINLGLTRTGGSATSSAELAGQTIMFDVAGDVAG
jgi:hypothetical protein